MTFHWVYQPANWKRRMMQGCLIFQAGIPWLSIDYITIVQFFWMIHLFFKDQRHNYFCFCAAPLPNVNPPRQTAPTAASREYNFYFQGIMFCLVFTFTVSCLCDSLLYWNFLFSLHRSHWCCSSQTSSTCSSKSPCPSCCSCSSSGSWWRSTGKRRSPGGVEGRKAN